MNKSLKLTLALRAEHNSNPNCNLNCASYLTTPFLQSSTSGDTPYNQMITVQPGRHLPRHRRHQPGAALWLRLVTGRQRQDRPSRRLRPLLRCLPAIFADNSMTNIPNLIPETLFGVSVGRSDTTAGRRLADRLQFGCGHPQRIRQRRLVQLADAPALPGFSAPNINNFVGTFKTPRYQEWSLQIAATAGRQELVHLGIRRQPWHQHADHQLPQCFRRWSRWSAGDSLQQQLRHVCRGLLGRSFQLQRSDRQLSAPHDVWIHGAGQLYLEPLAGRNLQRRSSWNAVQRSHQLSYQLNPLCLPAATTATRTTTFAIPLTPRIVWQTPWKFGNKFANGALVAGRLSQNFFARSGLPLTVLDSTSSIGNYSTATLPTSRRR